MEIFGKERFTSGATVELLPISVCPCTNVVAANPKSHG